MAKGVLVFVEQREGALKLTAFEAVTLGNEIKSKIEGDLSAVLIGSDIAGIIPELSEHGLDKVYMADDEGLKFYDGGRYAGIIEEAANKADPAVIIIVASSMGKDIAPRLASALGAGVATECTAVEVDDGRIVATRPVYAGKALVKLKFKSDPQILTIRPNVFLVSRQEPNAPEVIELEAGDRKEQVEGVEHVKSERPELTEASIIVSGGRGMGGPENFHLTEELADELGAAVGASRAVVDAGWRPHSEQVGQTGKTVSPNLYIACGISGAIQHLAGMLSSKNIVAINKDPDAPIFKVATYGIVGDLFEVVPKMIEEIRKIKG